MVTGVELAIGAAEWIMVTAHRCPDWHDVQQPGWRHLVRGPHVPSQRSLLSVCISGSIRIWIDPEKPSNRSSVTIGDQVVTLRYCRNLLEYAVGRKRDGGRWV